MKIPAPLARTAALLLLLSTPSALTALPASAQRRRPPARRAPAAGRPAPQRPQAAATPGATPRPQPAAPGAQTPATEDGAQQVQGAGADRPVEELIAADAYGVYVEVRKVGAVFAGSEVKAALGAAALIDKSAADVLRLGSFIADNSESLAEARVVVAVLPTRPDLPQPLVAVQLPSAEGAREFEPKFRAFADEQRGALAAAQAATARPARGGRRAARRRAAAPQRVAVLRAGSWLLAADRPFTLKRLAAGGAGPLADNARFQNLRSRFANDSVFVYFDTERTQQSWALQAREREAALAAQAAAAGVAPDSTEGQEETTSEIAVVAPVGADGRTASRPPSPPTLEITTGEETAAAAPQTAAPTPEGETPTEAPTETPTETPAGTLAVDGVPIAGGEQVVAAPPTEVQAATRGFGRLLDGLTAGMPRIPGAAAAGLGIEGGTISFRVAVENTPDGVVSLIPFLPNVVAGAPVTVEASAVAPVSNDILVVTSLDWEKIFDSLLGASKERDERLKTSLEAGRGGEDDDDDPEERRGPAVSTEASIAAVEKLLGFKLREELLPALGSEVAISLPLDFMTGSARVNRRGEKQAEEGKEEKDPAAPGFVVILALDNPERVREMLPNLSLLFGLGGDGAQSRTEKREGHEIRSGGPFVSAILGRFLVVSDDVKSVRNVVDSFARGETLANQNGYRDATAWQTQQRLAHAYLADTLMSMTIGETKRMAEGSSDPLVLSTLPQLDLRPEPISFATTNEGDILVHELRLPVSLGRVYAAAAVISAREAPNVMAEAAGAYAMQSISEAEQAYKSSKGGDRYATLEELTAAKLVEKSFLQSAEYRIELNAVGDRFEATATPKEYGKAGRRSFYVDQTGIVRGADHKGRPATALDPPVD